MLGIKCRLCSSDCALISLFNGKCRKNRDCIRKLVEITTGIKFQKDDEFKCICYPCTVEVYNFYIFKARSVENERILEAHNKKDEEKRKSNKIQILHLDDIILPDVKELQTTLAPWLLSKQKHCETTNSDCDPSDSNNVTNSLGKTVERSSQCDTVESSDISTQCCFVKNTSDKKTQSNPITTSDKGIQSKSLNSSHKGTQSNLLNPSFDKYTQCAVSNITIHTQTNGILTKSSNTQCCLIQDIRETPKNINRDSNTQTESMNMEKSTQYSVCDQNCTKIDCTCHMNKLLSIKQEPEPLSPLLLSPVKCLNVTPKKSHKVLSPIPSFPSPISTNLLFVKNRSRTLIICQQCDQTFYSKPSYKLHKKSHMVCSFCKKKFLSVKRTKTHIQNDCKVKKLITVKPVVQLTRLERLKNVRKKYPKCVEDIEAKGEIRSMVRMRSRSTSSVDSLYSNCSNCRVCKNSISLLQSLRLGTDKSVQANLLYDNPMVADFLFQKHTLKAVSEPKFENREDIVSPAKKIKLSSSFMQ